MNLSFSLNSYLPWFFLFIMTVHCFKGQHLKRYTADGWKKYSKELFKQEAVEIGEFLTNKLKGDVLKNKGLDLLLIWGKMFCFLGFKLQCLSASKSFKSFVFCVPEFIFSCSILLRVKRQMTLLHYISTFQSTVVDKKK